MMLGYRVDPPVHEMYTLPVFPPKYVIEAIHCCSKTITLTLAVRHTDTHSAVVYFLQ